MLSSLRYSGRVVAKPVTRQLFRETRIAGTALRNFADVAAVDDTSDDEAAHAEWKTYGGVSNYKPGKFQIKLYNKISAIGLGRLPDDHYDVHMEKDESPTPHAILLRSHKLKEEEVPPTVRAIARCGAGTNNIPVARMTELGIPVFNTPGANANAVKELIICGLFLGSRRVIEGINHMKQLGQQGLARERVEKDKAVFAGRELKGKTLAVIGLGNIGAATAHDACELGMDIQGYDPGLSVKTALKLPSRVKLMDSIQSAVAGADYVSLNIPYIKGEGGTHGIINADVIQHLKQGAVILNFARGELVDSEALKSHLDINDGRYISDFPDDILWNHPNCLITPHLGASTNEAEDAAAAMAAETIREFLEHGTIRNSVNFPETHLSDSSTDSVRFTIVNRNVPGCLAVITEAFAKEALNIAQQINQSRGDIAYNVIDIDTSTCNDVLRFKSLQERIMNLPDVLSTRVLLGTPGTGYARKVDGKFFIPKL